VASVDRNAAANRQRIFNRWYIPHPPHFTLSRSVRYLGELIHNPALFTDYITNITTGATDTPTATNTPTTTSTDTPVPTNTSTSTDTPTNTRTDTPTNTPLLTSTSTNTPVPTNTPTNTAVPTG